MEMDGGTLTVIGSMIVSVGGAVGTALKLLWGKVEAQSKATENALQECMDEHKVAGHKIDTLTTKMIDLTGTVSKLQGRIEGYQEAKTEAARKADEENGAAKAMLKLEHNPQDAADHT